MAERDVRVASQADARSAIHSARTDFWGLEFQTPFTRITVNTKSLKPLHGVEFAWCAKCFWRRGHR